MVDDDTTDQFCQTCGAELLGKVCPSCPAPCDGNAPTIPIPATAREHFHDTDRPPPPLECETLDDDEPIPDSVPTARETPAAKSDPPVKKATDS